MIGASASFGPFKKLRLNGHCCDGLLLWTLVTGVHAGFGGGQVGQTTPTRPLAAGKMRLLMGSKRSFFPSAPRTKQMNNQKTPNCLPWCLPGACWARPAAVGASPAASQQTLEPRPAPWHAQPVCWDRGSNLNQAPSQDGECESCGWTELDTGHQCSVSAGVVSSWQARSFPWHLF